MSAATEGITEWLAKIDLERYAPTPSRRPTHDSGSMWFATPSSWWTCTTYSLPVSRRTRK